MSPEKEEQLKSKIIQQIVGSVTFAEIVKIIHELATRETEHQFSEYTEEQKNEIYNELFPSEVQELPAETQ